MLQIKTIHGGRVKALDEAGKGLAVIATLNVIDKDDDVTMPGAFGVQEVKMVPAHDWSHIPIGKATIREAGDEAVAEFQLNMELNAGQQWYKALKFDMEMGTPLQEWSYGFSIDKASHGDRDGRGVRFLEALTVREISPVLVGAGVGTRTVALKHDGSQRFADQVAAAIAEVKDIAERARDVQAKRQADGRNMSPERVEQIKALSVALAELSQLSDMLIGVARVTAEADALLAEFTWLSTRR